MDEQRKWEEGTEPTPAQWTKWFLSLSDERQLQVAQQVIVGMQAAIKCVQSDHIGELTWLTQNHATQMHLGKWLLAEKEWEFTLRLQQVADKLEQKATEYDHD